LNLSTRESTLYTVLKDGTLEYPLVGSPVSVVGMTTDDIAKLLIAKIKVLSSPRLSVSVRDYASHAVMVTGAAGNPGRKILRREAMPLFAVLSEALVRPEATTVVVIHNGKEGAPINLKDEQAMTTLVVSGDTIKISGEQAGRTGKFIYVGGNVANPGEKTFREGMTLTQAVLSAGGTQSSKTTVKISRRNQNGFLVTSEYQMNSIEEGKAQDPQLEAGDRIEVTKI
jgi:protein involved in polysaccharide export with SLBB domain